MGYNYWQGFVEDGTRFVHRRDVLGGECWALSHATWETLSQLDAITAFAAWVDGASLKMTDTHRFSVQVYQHERWYPSWTQAISRLPADFGGTVECVPAFAMTGGGTLPPGETVALWKNSPRWWAESEPGSVVDPVAYLENGAGVVMGIDPAEPPEPEPPTDKERFLDLCRELVEHCSMRDDGDLEEVELLMKFDPDAAFCLQSLHRAEARLAGYLKSRLESDFERF